MKMYIVVVTVKSKIYVLYLNAKDSVEVKQFCDLIKCEHIAFSEF